MVFAAPGKPNPQKIVCTTDHSVLNGLITTLSVQLDENKKYDATYTWDTHDHSMSRTAVVASNMDQCHFSQTDARVLRCTKERERGELVGTVLQIYKDTRHAIGATGIEQTASFYIVELNSAELFNSRGDTEFALPNNGTATLRYDASDAPPVPGRPIDRCVVHPRANKDAK